MNARLPVIVLEAGSRVGGRVAQLHGFAPWPLQLGAEFVHGGENNVLVRLIERLGWSYRTLEWPDRYYFGTRGELGDGDGGYDTDADDAEKSLRGIVDAETAEAHPDVAEAHRLLANLPNTPWVETSRRRGDDDLRDDATESGSVEEACGTTPTRVAIDDIESSATKEVDCTALEWLVDRVKASRRVVEIAESVYANDFGCSLSTMGMRETAVEQREWCHGEEYILLDEGRHLGDLVQEVARGLDIRLNVAASAVEWRKKKAARKEGEKEENNDDKCVVVRAAGGRSFRASACVVASPISALKEMHWCPTFRTSVTFDPRVSQAKRDAIESIQMSDAVKICLAFREKFWPADVWNVVCCDAFLPECWMLEYAPSRKSRDENDRATFSSPRGDVRADIKAIVTFFACGETAKTIARRIREDPERGEAGVVDQALAQLDAMFGGEKENGATGEAAPATTRFVAAEAFPWSGVDTVGGAYTHPSVYAAGARRELQKPEYDGALFLAGEAANVKCNPCMQGAVTTGLEAAAAAAAERASRTGKPTPEGFGDERWFVRECF